MECTVKRICLALGQETKNINERTFISHFSIYVVVNFFSSQVIFVVVLFLSMVMYANEGETKEKYKLPKIKNQLQHSRGNYNLILSLQLSDKRFQEYCR